eukprot:403339265
MLAFSHNISQILITAIFMIITTYEQAGSMINVWVLFKHIQLIKKKAKTQYKLTVFRLITTMQKNPIQMKAVSVKEITVPVQKATGGVPKYTSQSLGKRKLTCWCHQYQKIGRFRESFNLWRFKTNNDCQIERISRIR